MIFVLPTAVLTPGVHGPFQSPAMGSTFSAYALQVAPGTSWPTSGNVLTILFERSQDGGTTWQFDAQVTFGPGPWTDKSGAAINGLVRVGMGVLNPGTQDLVLTTAPTDLYRMTLTALQRCAPVLTLTGIA